MNRNHSKYRLVICVVFVICLLIALCKSGILDPLINRRCVFYGQVVDSAGNVVAGAEVRATWRRSTLTRRIPIPVLWASSPKAFIDDEAVSDSSGRFVIKAYAENLKITSIKKGEFKCLNLPNFGDSELNNLDPTKPVRIEIASPSEIAEDQWRQKVDIYRTAHRNDPTTQSKIGK